MTNHNFPQLLKNISDISGMDIFYEPTIEETSARQNIDNAHSNLQELGHLADFAVLLKDPAKEWSGEECKKMALVGLREMGFNYGVDDEFASVHHIGVDGIRNILHAMALHGLDLRECIQEAWEQFRKDTDGCPIPYHKCRVEIDGVTTCLTAYRPVCIQHGESDYSDPIGLMVGGKVRMFSEMKFHAPVIGEIPADRVDWEAGQ